MTSHRKIFTHHVNKINDLSQIYNIIEIIGGGSFGTVYRAVHIRTEETKALKVGAKLDTPHKTKFYQEVRILSRLEHPNIIRLEAVYESKRKICLVLEYCPCELLKLFRETVLTEANVQRIMFYLTSAVVYLHDNGIVHRDLKLENILIGENPTNPKDSWFIKVCDFGVSACKQGTGFEAMFNEFCGTPMYMAPEMETKSYSEQCDIWSMGIIMFLLLEGQFPYNIGSNHNISEIISKTTVDFDLMKCSQSASALVRSCLEVNPALRITATEMFHSPWITGQASSDNNQQQSKNVLKLMNEYNKELDTSSVAISVTSRNSVKSKNVFRPSALGSLPAKFASVIRKNTIAEATEENKNDDFPKVVISSMTRDSSITSIKLHRDEKS